MRAPGYVSRMSRCVRDRGLSSTGCNRSVTLGVTTQTQPGPGLGALHMAKCEETEDPRSDLESKYV